MLQYDFPSAPLSEISTAIRRRCVCDNVDAWCNGDSVIAVME